MIQGGMNVEGSQLLLAVRFIRVEMNNILKKIKFLENSKLFF